MGPLVCPETSVTNYKYSLLKNQEERSSLLKLFHHQYYAALTDGQDGGKKRNHLLLCDNRLVSVHHNGGCCQTIPSCKSYHYAVGLGVLLLQFHNFNSSTHRPLILTSRIAYLTLWANVHKCKPAAHFQQPRTKSLPPLKASESPEFRLNCGAATCRVRQLPVLENKQGLHW
jgi:hypothetical protein